jgi:integrase
MVRPRLNQRTVRRHLTALSGLFRWVKEQGRYDGDNPAGGFTFPRSKRGRDERPGWAADQLQALFRSPIWTGCASPKRRAWPGSLIIKDAAYWLPLLGAFAGLRLEEASQLLVADVGTEAGAPFVHIRPGEGKLLKSMAAVRRVPLHPVLTDAGFLDYVATIRDQGHTLVFPTLRRGGPDGRLGTQVTKDFTEYRRAIGLYAKGRDFHALRHSFTTALVVAGVDRAIIDELTGHEGTGETSHYTKALPLSVLHDAIRRVDYGFDAGHLDPHPQGHHSYTGGRGGVITG